MGTIFQKIAGEIIMIAEDVIETIKSVAHKIEAEHTELDCTWYLFGSLLHGSDIPSDLDVAIVCHTQENVQLVRSYLAELLRELPTAHLTLMCTEEEQEFGFLARAGAQQIHPSPSKNERQTSAPAKSL
jgi:hypothetical protein